MQVVDFPSAIFQLVDEGIARLHDGDGFRVWVGQSHVPGAQAGCDVAANLDGAGLDGANWAVLQEANEIIVDGFWRRAWGVGYGRQQDSVLCEQRGHFGWVFSGPSGIELREQAFDLRRGRVSTLHFASAGLRRSRGKGDHGREG